MLDFIPELSILHLVVDKRQSFQSAVFDVTVKEKVDKREIPQIRSYVSGVLVEFQPLVFECLDTLPYDREDPTFLLNMILLFHLRNKTEEEEEIRKKYLLTFDKMRYEGNPFENFEKLQERAKTPFVIPDEIKKKAENLYYSLFYLLPKFYVELLIKQWGKEMMKKIAYNIRTKRENYFFSLEDKPLNEALTPYLEPVSLEGFHSALYKTRDDVKKSFTLAELKNENKLLPVPYLFLKAISEVELPEIQPRLLILGGQNAFSPAPFAIKIKDSFEPELSYQISKPEHYRLAISLIHLYHFYFIKPIICKDNLLSSHFEENSYDLVVTLAKSTKDSIGRTLEEKMSYLSLEDFYHAREQIQIQLNQNKDFVKVGGTLLFLCFSFDQEQTTEAINRFLKRNPNFKLIKEEMIFPQRKKSNSGYYALLRRLQ